MESKILEKSKIKNEIYNSFTCIMCQQSFELEDDYMEHRKIHMKSLKLKLVETDSVENLQKQKEIKFLCIYCNEEFENEASRSRHHSKVHPNPFESDTESEEYEYYGDLRAQSLLSFSLLEEEDMMVDVSTRIKSEGSGFNCEICQRHFTRKQALKNHMYIHNGLPKPHRCPYEECPRSFIKAVEMRRHFYTHNPEVDRPKNFRCDRSGCYKAFAFAADLKKHQMIHDNPLARKYQCMECYKRFSRSEHLKRHRLIHLPEDQIDFHVCQLCERKFRRKDGLTKHMLTHNDKKDFSFSLLMQHSTKSNSHQKVPKRDPTYY